MTSLVAGLAACVARDRYAEVDSAPDSTFGSQALDGAGTLRAHRAADDLRDLRRLAESHAHLTEVADLRDRIGTVVAA